VGVALGWESNWRLAVGGSRRRDASREGKVHARERKCVWAAPEPRMIGREMLESESCFVLDLGPEWDDTLLFIREGTFLLRREFTARHDVNYHALFDV